MAGMKKLNDHSELTMSNDKKKATWFNMRDEEMFRKKSATKSTTHYSRLAQNTATVPSVKVGIS